MRLIILIAILATIAESQKIIRIDNTFGQFKMKIINGELMKELTKDYYMGKGIIAAPKKVNCFNEGNERDGCMYDNNNTDYKFTFLPPHPLKNEHINKPNFISRYLLNDEKLQQDVLYSGKWQIDLNDILLIVGNKTHSFRHNSLTPYLNSEYSRIFKWKITPSCSLGDPLHMNSSFYDKNNQFVIVATVNTEAKNEIANILSKYYEKIYYIDFPGTVFNRYVNVGPKYGLDEKSSYYQFMFRFTVPQNRTEWEEIENNIPIEIYRLTPNGRKIKNSKKEKCIHNPEQCKHPKPIIKPKKANLTAPSMIDKKAEKELNELYGVVEEYNQKQGYITTRSWISLDATRIANAGWGGEALARFFISLPLYLDTRGCTYCITLPWFTLDEDTWIYVFGSTNRKMTEYSNLNFYQEKSKLSLISLMDNEIEGTALGWKYENGTSITDNKELFIVKYSLSESIQEENIKSVILANDGVYGSSSKHTLYTFHYFQRFYINPQTGVGPDESDLVLSKYLMVQKIRIYKLFGNELPSNLNYLINRLRIPYALKGEFIRMLLLSFHAEIIMIIVIILFLYIRIKYMS